MGKGGEGGGAEGGGGCGFIACLIIGAVFMAAGAYPQRHQMNGFRSALGTVTDAHWYIQHSSDGGDSINVFMHYQFGGSVEVTNDVVNGTTTSHYKFIGGHNCRRKFPINVKSTRDAQPWIDGHYPVGKQETVYYRPPNAAKCFSLYDLNYNYNVGVTLLTLFGFCTLVPIVCLFAYSLNKDQNPVVTIFGGLCLLIFSPIILPFALGYCLLQALGCFNHPPEHPITQYTESVKENYFHASGKFTSAAATMSAKMGMSSKERTEREKEPEVDGHADVEAVQLSVDEAPSTAIITGGGYAEMTTLPPPPPPRFDEVDVDVELAAAPDSAQPEITVLPEEPNYSQDQSLIGRKVEARKTGGDERHSATITDVHYDGSFDVEFDNGAKEMFVPRSSIRLL